MGGMKKSFLSKLLILLAIPVFMIGNLYLSQERLIFTSKPLPESHKYYFKDPFEESLISTKSGSKISLVRFKAQNPKGAVLYFHGKGENIQTFWWLVAKDFTDRGYDVYLFDYPGFGKSKGHLSEDNLLQDSLEIYDFVKKSYSEDQIIIYGRSLGTSFATFVASKNNPKLLILDSPYTSLIDASKAVKPFLPKWLISSVLKFHLPSIQWIENVHSKVVILHGKKDQLIPFSQGEALAVHAKQSHVDVEFVPLEKTDHYTTAYDLTYQQKLDELLK